MHSLSTLTDCFFRFTLGRDIQYHPEHFYGEAAISHLAGGGKGGNNEPMDNSTVLLLQWIRASEAWADLPVIILTSSDDPGDKARANNLGASAYVIKKFPFKNLLNVLEST